MQRKDFLKALKTLEINQTEAASLFGYSRRQVGNWGVAGTPVPAPVCIFLQFCVQVPTAWGLFKAWRFMAGQGSGVGADGGAGASKGGVRF